MNTPIKMHVALSVSDLPRSVAFYEAFFGLAPAKQFDDFAKFEVENPPLVFSLNPAAKGEEGAASRGGSLSHLGIRLPSSEALTDLRSRLAETDLRLRDEPGTTCCYALQDKVWMTDPDGNAWEVYWLREDTAAHSHEASSCCEPSTEGTGCC